MRHRYLSIKRRRQIELIVILCIVAFAYFQGFKNGIQNFSEERERLKDEAYITKVMPYVSSQTTNQSISLTINSSLSSNPHQSHNSDASQNNFQTNERTSNYDASLLIQDEESIQDPCEGRPQPAEILNRRLDPPSIYFLHIPKTAGTLVYSLLLRYANRTNGLSCQFLYDGNRFLPEDFQMGVKPPPVFPPGSMEAQAVEAYTQRDRPKKSNLYKNGVCRIVRGHVTYWQRDFIQKPVISLTILRDPVERFVSMYEFVVSMMRSRPGATGWDEWFSGGPLEDEFRNASSLVNHGFYDDQGRWLARKNVGFSFHFYGVLHQLSGLIPRFEGVRTTDRFRISNAAMLAEKAKDNICSTHILGLQSDMTQALDDIFEAMAPFSDWTEQEQSHVKRSVVNRNTRRKSRDISDHLPSHLQAELKKRLEHEIQVYEFAKKVIQYRRSKGLKFY